MKHNACDVYVCPYHDVKDKVEKLFFSWFMEIIALKAKPNQSPAWIKGIEPPYLSKRSNYAIDPRLNIVFGV